MPELLWSDQGSFTFSPKLSKALFFENQPIHRFRNFCSVKKALGQNKGSTVNFDKISELATQGGTLVETNTTPKTKFTITQGTGVVNEYGNSISITKKFKTLSEIELKSLMNRSLKVDSRRTLDEAAALEFNKCLVRAVATASGALAFTTNGTATATNTSAMTRHAVKGIVDRMVEYDVPTYDGQHYICLASVKAVRGIFDEIEPLSAYVKDVRALPGEVGRYYDCRIVRATWGIGSLWRTARYSVVSGATGPLVNGAWTSGLSDEAYFFGSETVMEIIALLEQIRGEEKDLGREQILGWYALLGYKIIWGDSGDADDSKIYKWDSAA